MKTDGYKVIAVRDDTLGKCVVSFNKETKLYLVAINGKITGPFTLAELRGCYENIKDVLELWGRYLFIEEYDIFGNQKEK